MQQQFQVVIGQYVAYCNLLIAQSVGYNLKHVTTCSNKTVTLGNKTLMKQFMKNVTGNVQIAYIKYLFVKKTSQLLDFANVHNF